MLRSAFNSASNFTEKLHGPLPSDDGCDPEDGPASLRSVAFDLRKLAAMIGEELSNNHNTLGFERLQSGGGVAGNSARNALR